MIKYCIILFSIIITSTLVSQTQTDANGKKQGYWRKKDNKSNKLIYEGLFKDSKPQGTFKYYYPNDSIKAIMKFKQDGQISYSTLFHMNGKKMAAGKYISENKDSVWNYFDEKGLLISTETYLNGLKNGKESVYFSDGIVSEERNYKSGKLNGPYKLYFDKALVKNEGTYEEGQLDGKNVFYFPNGITAATGYYNKGLKTGPWIYRDKTGKITEKELYANSGKLANKKETDDFFSKHKPAEEKPKSTDATTTKQKTKPVKKAATKK